jgi:hypothetical protein
MELSSQSYVLKTIEEIMQTLIDIKREFSEFKQVHILQVFLIYFDIPD